MRTFLCHCCKPPTRLFFDNTLCLVCDSAVGWCPECQNMTALKPVADHFQCMTPSCQTLLQKCFNSTQYGVCNRTNTLADDLKYHGLCECCRHNVMIPDLSIDGHRERWAALEAAKSRLFYTLDLMGLPHACPQDGAAFPLTFSFMADALPDDGLWRPTQGSDKVYTGHAGGHITINLMETDDVERERLRVDLNEPQRTLIGHFRHEIGHYYWDLLIKDQYEAKSVEIFGDHTSPTYSEALELYYQNGPTPNWWQTHVSAYATMHPWEDFAETFAAYENIVAVLDTANNMGLLSDTLQTGVAAMISKYQQVGVVLNELNREMGLLDFVPVVITPAIHKKLEFIHEMVERAAIH